MARALLVSLTVVGIASASSAAGGSSADRVRRHLAHLVASERVREPVATVHGPRSTAPPGVAVTYYVDAGQGNNANPGTSPDRAWRSIARVNHGRYGAGDAILFRGAQTFRGTLRFTPRNAAGTAAAPITVGSFGDGRATLDAHRRSALLAHNVAGFHITGLTLVGGRRGPCHGASHGILFESGGTNTTLSHIAIDHVEVSGFCEGISVGTDDDASKLDDVRITDAVVHQNGDAGINTFDPALAHHDVSHVYVARVVAHDNADTGGIVRAQLVDQGAPATANRVLSALRGTLRAAWRAGMMDAASYHAARDVRGARGSRLPRGRAVGSEEWRRLFREIGYERPPMRERDTALVALAYAGGFRRAELVALDLADYDRESGRLRVIGKGNKERGVFVSNGARDALHAWLRVRGPAAGPLLLPVDRHGHVLARRLTEQTVYDRLRYLAERAGVAAFSPHDCRRSLAGDLLDAGVDLATVQAMLGHASPATTARYDRRGERAVRQAADRVQVPYTGI